jgi:hypothetical protein
MWSKCIECGIFCYPLFLSLKILFLKVPCSISYFSPPISNSLKSTKENGLCSINTISLIFSFIAHRSLRNHESPGNHHDVSLSSEVSPSNEVILLPILSEITSPVLLSRTQLNHICSSLCCFLGMMGIR